jgi:class 3 adenylate cyclase
MDIAARIHIASLHDKLVRALASLNCHPYLLLNCHKKLRFLLLCAAHTVESGMTILKTKKPTRTPARMDFSMKVLKMDKDTQVVHFQLEPDPRRYTPVDKDGERWYLDKYLKHLIPLRDFVEQMPGLPIYHLAPSVDSASEYAARRKGAVEHELRTGEHIQPKESALSHEALNKNNSTRSVSFLSVDICGATALRQMQAEDFDKAHKVMISEFGTTVGQFNGSILKLTGDGFIACIDHPSFTSLCDATVDLGLSLLTILRESINPALKAQNLPQLDIRIGADYGEAEFKEIRIPSTGYSDVEVASDALNRSVKIQESAGKNELRIGRSLYELVHVQWLERATETSFDGSQVGIKGYKTYRIL